MKFINQKHIVTEIAEYVPAIIRGTNLNILFRGPSGYGKTHLSFNFCLTVANETKDKYEYLLPDEAGFVRIDERKRIHIVDEVHLLKEPERLYPLMDSKKYLFIFASNEAGELKEPLTNRCIGFNFVEYGKEEICQIIDTYFTDNKINLPHNYLELIYENCNGVPRTAKLISQRLLMMIQNRGVPTYDELKRIIYDVFQIQDGLDYRHKSYLNFIQKAGTASLDLISYAIKLDKATIKRDIEPVLINKGLIKISSRGRTCNQLRN